MRWEALLGTVLLMPLAAGSDRAPSDTVELAARRQVIDHFTASDAWTCQFVGLWAPDARERVADLLFSTETGIGLSMWRFNLGAGLDPEAIGDRFRTAETFETAAGEYDWTRQAGQRYFLRAAKARGVERFLAFCCSPPARLTRNGLSHGRGVAGTSNLKPGAEPDFARYLCDVVEHFGANPDDSERVRFGWVSPVNEPQWKWDGGQEGMRASNGDLLAIVTALRDAIAARGLPTRVHVAESGQLGDLLRLNQNATREFGAEYGAYLPLVAGRDDLAEVLGRTIGYHSYWSDGGNLIDARRELRQALAAYDGWQAWQTEYCLMEWHRDLSMGSALRIARTIWADLTIADCAGWGWWLAVSPYDYKDGLLYTDWRAPGDPETVFASKMLWALGHWSRFVRPGYVRVEITGPDDGVLRSAFVSPDGRRLVVVYVNPGGRRNVRLAIDAPMTPYRTSDVPGEDLLELPPITPAAGFELPARCLVTLAGELPDLPGAP